MATVDERMARLEERVSAMREDLQEVRAFGADNRKRIHDLEGGQQAVRVLAETVQRLPAELRGVAKTAAQEALRESASDRRGAISLRAQVAAGAFAFVVSACSIVTTVIAASGGLR